MPWNAYHNQTLQVVELVFEGGITGRELQESTSKCIALGKENTTSKFLVDAAEAELSVPLVDVYNLPEKQYVDDKADRFSRVAVILPNSSKSRDVVYFYETVCRNRGWMATVFLKREEAVDWLIGGNNCGDVG